MTDRAGTAYELIVAGPMGPVLSAAFAEYQPTTVVPCTVLRLHDQEGRDLVDVVRLLESAQLVVREVRLIHIG